MISNVLALVSITSLEKMPLSKIAFIRLTVIAILVGMAALFAVVASTLWLVTQTRNNAAVIGDATLLRNAILVLRSDIQDAETGQRGYLLTRNSVYLVPYNNALDRFARQMEAVRTSLFADDHEGDAATLDRLSAILNDKLAEMKQTVDLAEAGRREEALGIVQTNRDLDLMQEARGLLAGMIEHADTQVKARLATQSRAITSLYWVTLLGSLVIIAVVGGSVWTVIVYTRQLIAARREVESLNCGLEDRVRERTVDLDRANQEIQRFAYIVTHDLRAPLVNIMGFTSELEASLAEIQPLMVGLPSDEDDPAAKRAREAVQAEVPEAISFIRSSTQKMDRLINAILKLSREGRRTLRPQPIDLESLLQAAAASVQHQLTAAGGEVTIECRAPRIVSDRMALEQIFGNLLDNAVKYKAPDRPLRIQMRARPESAQRIVIEFEDNGRGIAAEDQERVFDLFRRSGQQDQPGEGIGLAHVRTSIPSSLGGEVSLQSELDRATTFILHIPADLRKITGATSPWIEPADPSRSS